MECAEFLDNNPWNEKELKKNKQLLRFGIKSVLTWREVVSDRDYLPGNNESVGGHRYLYLLTLLDSFSNNFSRDFTDSLRATMHLTLRELHSSHSQILPTQTSKQAKVSLIVLISQS